MLILADAFPIQALALLGLNILGTFVLIILVEATVLWWLKWDSYGLSVLDSLLINVTSSIIGIIINVLNYLPSKLPELLVISWILSILVEGVLLSLLRRQPLQKTWLAALAANIASYLMLSALIFWLRR